MISTISRDSEGTKTKSRRNELEDLRYGLSNHETLKLNVLCISLTLKARKIPGKLIRSTAHPRPELGSKANPNFWTCSWQVQESGLRTPLSINPERTPGFRPASRRVDFRILDAFLQALMWKIPNPLIVPEDSKYRIFSTEIQWLPHSLSEDYSYSLERKEAKSSY